MTFLLLTGAGFSHNWGGPLASEVFSALLADKDIDEPTRDRLFDAPGGFEQVLADLQLSTDPDDKRRHDALITSVVGIFNGMNNTFMHMQFGFENPPSVRHSMARFLSRFAGEKPPELALGHLRWIAFEIGNYVGVKHGHVVAHGDRRERLHGPQAVEIKLNRSGGPHYVIFVGVDKSGEWLLTAFPTMGDPVDFRTRHKLGAFPGIGKSSGEN